MKPYPDYKDSGIEWIEKIPAHWVLIRIKYTVKLIIEKAEGSSIDTFKIALENIESNTGGYIKKNNYFEGAGNFFKTGDVLFNKLRPYLCKVFVADKDGIAVGELLVLRPSENMNVKYLYYRFLSKDFIDIVDSSTYGSKMPRASWEFIGNLKYPLPNYIEQKAIAAYLDHKTRQIDLLIKKKERLIELLKEQRTAIINRAVTRGLNPDVKLKDSGIEWLGKIPEHWQVKRIKYILKILRGQFSHRPRNDPKFYGGEYPFIQTGDISKANKIIYKYHQTLNKLGYSISREFEKGTIVMSIAANIGDIAILNFNACFPDSIVAFIPYKKNSPDYLFYNFKLMKEEFLKTSIINTQFNINIGRIADLSTVYPPYEEQVEISDYIDKKCNEIDAIINKELKIIELLKEYRTAVISAAVTGKIDVREFKP